MLLIVCIPGFNGEANRDVYRIGKFTDTQSDLFFIRPVITAVTILSEVCFIPMQDYAGSVHIDVSMLKIVSFKQDVLYV